MLKVEKNPEGDEIHVLVGDSELEIMDADGERIFVECGLEEIAQVPVNEVPDGLILHMHDSTGFGTYLFYEATVRRHDGEPVIDFICHQPNKYWEGRWGLATLLAAVRDQLPHHEGLSVGDIELEDDWKRLEVTARTGGSTIKEHVTRISSELKKVITESEIALSGLQWKIDYETDEKKFCIDVLLPLLRRMGFLQVRYNHGTKEYGKDFTFSEMTPLGDMRHYGLQAKAGDLSGGANALIDTILGQLNDAFSMPYHELGTKDDRYISTFILAVSGRFTENAREKIANKINKGLMGSVYFLDRDRILELIDRYWRK